MVVSVVYDMEADPTQKMLKFLHRFLTHVQNSVLEGDVTEGDHERIRTGVDDLFNPGESTIIYRVSSERMARGMYSEILPLTINFCEPSRCPSTPQGFVDYSGSTETMKCGKAVEAHMWPNRPCFRRTLVGSKRP